MAHKIYSCPGTITRESKFKFFKRDLDELFLCICNKLIQKQLKSIYEVFLYDIQIDINDRVSILRVKLTVQVCEKQYF